MTTAGAVAAFATGLTLGGSLIVAIGAQNTFVLQQGLRREHVGWVVAVCAALDIALMSVGVAGLGVALTSRPALLKATAIAGAVVLCAYALAAFRRALLAHALRADAAGPARPLRRVLSQTVAISLLNPHVYLDTVVLVGAVGARQPTGTQGAFLLGASLASSVWFSALGYGARALSPLFARPVSWRVLDVAVGVTMATIAWRLAAEALGG